MDRLSEFVYRFLPTPDANVAWQQPAAEEMVKVLHRWNVQAVTQEDAEKRPWFVFHCFFQRLSRVPLNSEDLRQDCWEVEFVRRLPEKPLSRDGMFSSEDELVEKLRELTKLLGARPSNQVATLVTNIAEKMDYDSWKQQAERVIHHDREEESKKVSQFVKPFRRKKS